jgi:uncharacterized protein (DUF362 family)
VRGSRVISAKLKGNTVFDRERTGVLLDRTVERLTGAGDAADAWRALFSPHDHVSIKVNCLGGPGMSTDVTLVMTVVERLEKCGIRPDRIIVWDRFTRELEEAGYPLSRGGSGLQVYGTDDAGYSRELYEGNSVGSLFSRILTERCNKIINMPILKDHGICGMTFAMKNYFGAIHNPNKYHLNRCTPYIGDLNAMPLIREREILIIGDLGRVQAEGGPSFKSAWAVPYGGVIVGTDPVAVDWAALETLERIRRKIGKPALAEKGLYPDYIEAAALTDAGDIEGMEHERIEV